MSESHKYDNDDPFGFGKPSEPDKVDPNDPFGFNKKPDPNAADYEDSRVGDWLAENIDRNAPLSPSQRQDGETFDQWWNRREAEKHAAENPVPADDSDENDAAEELLDAGPLPWNIDKGIVVSKRDEGMKDTHDASYVPTVYEMQSYFSHMHEHASEQASREEYRHLSRTMSGLESSLDSSLSKLNGIISDRKPNDQRAYKVEEIVNGIDEVLERLNTQGDPDHEALCRMPYGLLFMRKLHDSRLKLSHRAGQQDDVTLVSLRFHLEQLKGFAHVVRQSVGSGKGVTAKHVLNAVDVYEERTTLRDANRMIDITAPEANLLDDGLSIGITSADEIASTLDQWIYAMELPPSNSFRQNLKFDSKRLRHLGSNILSLVHGEGGVGARELRLLADRYAGVDPEMNVGPLLAMFGTTGLYGGAEAGVPQTYWRAYNAFTKVIDGKTRDNIDDRYISAFTEMRDATLEMKKLLEWYAGHMPLVTHMKEAMASRNTIGAKVRRLLPFGGKKEKLEPTKRPLSKEESEQELENLLGSLERKA